MHSMSFNRIFWKEFRGQRVFWIALFGLAVLLQLCATAAPSNFFWQNTSPFQVATDFALILACSFGVGSAAIGFAGETEAKTKSLLQRVPIRPRNLLLGKIALTLIGSYVLLITLLLSGCLLFSAVAEPPRAFFWNFGLGQFLLTPIEFVAVGVLVSLILGDVLKTVLVSGAVTAAFLAIPTVHDRLGLQGVFVVVLLAADALLVPVWLRDAGWVPGRSWFPSLTWNRQVATAPIRFADGRRSPIAWRRGAQSLLWKEWRQAWPVSALVLGIGVLLIGVTGSLWAISQRKDYLLGSLLPLLLMPTPLVFGLGSAASDRKGHAHRLLAATGVAGDSLWLYKHVVWLTLALAVSLAIVETEWHAAQISGVAKWRFDNLWSATSDLAEGPFGSRARILSPVLVSSFYVLLLYSFSFLMGVLISNTTVAFFSALLLYPFLLVFWNLGGRLGIPFWWTVGLFPLIFLVPTWLRMGDTLRERTGMAAWTKVLAAIVAPFLAMIVAVIIFRVVEIPASPGPELLADVLRIEPPRNPPGAPESLFVSAVRAVRPPKPKNNWIYGDADWSQLSPDQKTWIDDNDAACKLALKAATLPPGRFPEEDNLPQSELVARSQRGRMLLDVLKFSAQKLESENSLDQALACYEASMRFAADNAASGIPFPSRVPGVTTQHILQSMQRWAAHPKQTPGRIKKAIRFFEKFVEDGPSLSSDLFVEWQIDRGHLHKAIWDGGTIEENPKTVAELRWTRWLMPWELLRMERLYDAIYTRVIMEVKQEEQELKRQGFILMNADRLRWREPQNGPWWFARTTLNFPADVSGFPETFRVQTVDWRALERLELIALAIAGYRHEHDGKFPDSLAALVPAYFEHVPIDPWSGRAFLYEPAGLPVRIEHRGNEIPVHEPFLASVGIDDSRFASIHDPQTGLTSTGVVTRAGIQDAVANHWAQGEVWFEAPVVGIRTFKSAKTQPASPKAGLPKNPGHANPSSVPSASKESRRMSPASASSTAKQPSASSAKSP
jgi:hypothetical protein